KARVLDGWMCKSAFSYTTGLATIRRTAAADAVRLRTYKIPIQRVARRWCLDPALIAAFMSQESRALPVTDNSWDQYWQVGRQRQLPFGLWDSEENLNQGSTMLVLALNDVRARHADWSWDRQLR
ncbi:LYG protein, partial [Halcyon senegalensis]|nr:LYG protein [Halcyon senegalensis]